MVEPKWTSFEENKPEFFSLVGGVNTPGFGASFVGVVCSAIDESLNTWKYWIYKAVGIESSLEDRVSALMDFQNLPTDFDKGVLRSKAAYERIRCFDIPTAPAGRTSYVTFPNIAFHKILERRINSLSHHEQMEYDLKAGFEVVFIDPKEKRDEILEWVDCLYSAVVGETQIIDKEAHRTSRVVFLPHHQDNIQTVIQSLGDIEVSREGKVTADPMALALVLTIGRVEYLSKLGQTPIQIYKAQEEAKKGD